MNWLANVIERFKKKWNKRTIIAIKDEACTLYQIKEYDSLLWLTYNGQLIVPFTLICNTNNDVAECVALLEVIREMYVKRMIGTNYENKR